MTGRISPKEGPLTTYHLAR